jgi:hypothetical protein
MTYELVLRTGAEERVIGRYPTRERAEEEKALRERLPWRQGELTIRPRKADDG